MKANRKEKKNNNKSFISSFFGGVIFGFLSLPKQISKTKIEKKKETETKVLIWDFGSPLTIAGEG